MANLCSWCDRDWLKALLLIAATFLAYQPVWHAGFIWDDDDYVTSNLALRSRAGLRQIWLEPGAASQYYPLTFTSFWMEYHLWGVHPLGYHLINVGLHTLNALLVGLILRRLGVKGAWLGAGLFALHPVCVESVAWVTERKNTLSGLFFLGSILAGLRFWLGGTMDLESSGPRSEQDSGAGFGEWRRYWVALGLYVCALWSKTAGVGLPVVLLLVVWWKRGGLKRRDVYLALPFVVVGMGLGLLTMWTEKHYTGAEGKQWAFTWGERCVLAGRALWFYLGKLVWPHPLIFVYPRWRIKATGVLSYVPVLAAAAVLVVCWYYRRRWGKAVLLGLGYFVVMLLPVLGFVNIYFMKYSLVADHWQYFAIIGPIGLAAAGLATALARFKTDKPFLEPLLCGVLLLMLAVLTWRQCRMYANNETLWRATVARNPNCSMARICLGNLLFEKGEVDQAMAHYERVLQTQPGSAEARNNLGNALLQKGRADEAIAQYEAALEIDPAFARAHFNFGNALLRELRTDEAITHFRKVLQIQPDFAEARNNLGNALLQARRVDEAIAQFQKAVETRPDYAQAHYNLGNALLQRGRAAEAAVHYRRALEISPDLAEAHYNLGTILVKTGHAEEALAQFQKALEIHPDSIEVCNNLALLLATSPKGSVRNAARAIELAQRANRLSGGQDPEIIATLAAAYAGARRFDEAIATVQQAIQFATVRTNAALMNTLRGHLELYRADSPLRDTTPTIAPAPAGQPEPAQ